MLTKLDGAFLCTKHAIPLLQQSDNPSVTYITSVDGERPDGDYIGYQVGTAGLIAMTKANAVYLGRKHGIRVNAVAPGPVRTQLWGPDLTNEDMWQRFNTKSPLHRVGTGTEAGDACVFLANDPHRFLNGAFIDVDGGSRLV